MKYRKLIIMVAFCLLFLEIGIFLKQALKIPIARVSPVGRATQYLNITSKYLSMYYENYGESKEDIKTSDVINFLENECKPFSSHVFSHKPETSDKYDFGVFLYLPKELKSKSPTIVAYTTPLEKEDRIYRIVLVLNGTILSEIKIENYDFEKFLADNNTDINHPPDFYLSP